MTNNDYNNGHAANDDYTGFTYEMEEPIAVKGFSVTYDRVEDEISRAQGKRGQRWLLQVAGD